MTQNTASSSTTDDPLRSYVIFRRENTEPQEGVASDILAVVDRSSNNFVDASAEAGKSYYYRLASRSSLGMISNYSESVSNQLVTSNERPRRIDSRKTTIVSVFPNPARQSATITYYLASPTYVEIKLHDSIGRRTTDLNTEQSQPGLYSKEIDTRTLASGVYHVVLRTEDGLSSWPLMVQR